MSPTGARRSRASAVAPVVALIAAGLALVPTLPFAAPPARATIPSPGTWRTTGPMNTPRVAFSLTVLTGTPCIPEPAPAWCGSVLAAGGTNGEALASAEVYDPATGAWRPTGSMHERHGAGHVAVALASGQVLVVGGSQARNSAELFDPATGTWRRAAAPPFAVYGDAGALLPDGRVLVLAPEDDGAGRAELFDPAGDGGAGTWAPTVPPAQPHPTPTLTVLDDGTVLAVGGASAESYQPATQTWVPAGALPFPISQRGLDCDSRPCHSATRLPDGSVLVTGTPRLDTSGDIPSPVADGASLYEPGTLAWKVVGRTNEVRRSQPAVLAGRRVLIAGGGAGTGTAEVYDLDDPPPEGGTWQPTGTLVQARAGHAMVTLPDGRVLAAGGYGDAGQSPATRSAELFEPESLVQPPSVVALDPPAAPAGGDGRATVVVSGAGLTGTGLAVSFGGAPADVLSASPTSLTVAAPARSPGSAAVTVTTAAGASAATADARFTYFEPTMTSTEPAFPSSDDETPPQARKDHTATTLTGGQVLVVGGSTATARLDTAETYTRAGTGDWAREDAGALAAARSLHTATALGDGRVLVTGGLGTGLNGDESLASAELYVPGSGWSPGGAMSSGRHGHTATLLPTGRVLVAGGTGRSPTGTVALASVEVFDPATGTWASAGSLQAARAGHTATLLDGEACRQPVPPSWCGRVLVAGGDAGPGTTAELYDPVSGTSAPTGPMLESRRSHTATSVTAPCPEGEAGGGPPCAGVLVVGGATSVAAELYRPDAGRFEYAGRLRSARTGHTATALPGGAVLVAGGVGATGNRVEIFDPVLREWSLAVQLLSTRTGHSASLLPDGRVLLAGGCLGGGCTGLPVAELLQVPVGVPPPAVTAIDPPAGPSATTTRVTLRGSDLGGVTAVRFGTRMATLVAPATDRAVVVEAPAQAQGTVPVVLTHSRTGEVSSPAAVFTYGPGAWRPTGPLERGRFLHAAAPLPGGRVLVAGGTTNYYDFTRVPVPTEDRVPRPMASAEIYDPRDGRWRASPPMATARFAHTATALADGRVLVAGGQDDQGQAVASAEVYDPGTGSWSPAGALDSARFSHTATLLPDGRVLVAGGAVTEEQRFVPLAGAELFDPRTGLWSPAGPMAVPRQFQTATVLDGHRVLVAGGLTGPEVSRLPPGGDPATPAPPQVGLAATPSAEIFDARTGVWTATGSLDVARYIHTATLLDGPGCHRPDRRPECGRVLVAGGGEGGAAGSTSTELFDPSSGTWSPGSPMLRALAGHTATLLPDGSVLMAGSGALFPGDPQPGPLAVAEVYDPARGWRHTTSLGSARAGHTTSLLADGTVLVAGGFAAVTKVDAEETADQFRFTLSDPAEVYVPAPTVSRIGPGSGPVGARTPVELRGTGFAGATVVRFGEGPDAAGAEFDVVSPTMLTAVSPPRASAGAVAVTVDNAGGTSAHLPPFAPPRFTYTSGGEEGPSVAAGDASRCPAPPDPPSAHVSYPGGRYALVGLPERTRVGADSPLYGWLDRGAGGSYDVSPATDPVAAGRGYWAYFSCPRKVELSGPGAGSVALALGAYHASMVGNPSGTSPAAASGQDFAARWDPTANDGAGGYRLSTYRAPEALAVGEGAWVFSYVRTEIRIEAAG